MSSLSTDDILHIAKLARLHISAAEVEKFATELSAIFGYIETLQEVDTSAVEAAGQVTGLSGVFREDTVLHDTDPDALLGCSPLPIVDHQIQTPSAHG